MTSINLINSNQNHLSPEAIRVFSDLERISVTEDLHALIDRTSGAGMLYWENTLQMNANYVQRSTPAWLASAIGHDAFHLYTYHTGGSVSDEVGPNKFGYAVAADVGGDAFELEYIYGQYIKAQKQ